MINSIYGGQEENLHQVVKLILPELEKFNKETMKKTGHPIYEHSSYRIKSESSMREKCIRKGTTPTPEHALKTIKDAVGIRIVTGFLEDIYTLRDHIRTLDFCRVIQEKDYVFHSKPNGYRSYHMILEVTLPAKDIEGNSPGIFYAEIQLRTIAMDCWASLEHELKYKKKDISEQKIIVRELKRCANELSSCDVTMQTIRNLIRNND